MATNTTAAFGVWVTGLPASGKSTLVAALKLQFADLGIDVAVLESDVLRSVLTPNPLYDEAERETFYGQMVYIGALLWRHGVPVIFDATASRRAFRELARKQIPRFIEVLVETPLELCMARDPKGIYRRGAKAENTVPGLGAGYERPLNPDVVVRGDRDNPETGAGKVIARLREKGYLSER